MKMSNLPIVVKILLVIAIMASVAIGITVYASWGLNILSKATDEIKEAGNEMETGARLNQNIIELNRGEYRLAANPGDLDEVVKLSEGYKAALLDRLGRLKKTADPEQARLLAVVEQRWQEYLPELESTFKVARKYTSTTMSEAQEALLREVAQSRAKAAALREAVVKYGDYTDDQAEKVSNEASKTADEVSRNLMIFAGVGILAGVVIGFFIGRSGIVAPVSRMQAVIQEIEKTGNLDMRVDVDGTDEISKTGGAINNFLNTLQRLLGTLGQIEKTGDLTLRMADFGQTSQVTNAFLENLESAFQEIADVATQVGQSAEQLNSASQNMASTSEEQSSAVEEVTSSVEETDSQVKANTDAANAANQLVMGTSQAANEGQSKMNAMVTSMNEINGSAQDIAKIIKVIDEIAFQTNLLALNAAVEAARAGQHGRGFAVVAQEVRNLAGRSAKAARETAELIENSVRQVESGVGIAGQTSEALNQIVGNVVKVKDLVGEIAAASGEQSRGVAQINVAINQVAKAAQEGSQQAEELASTAEEMTAATERMLQEIRRFKLSDRRGGGRNDRLSTDMMAQIKAMMAAQGHPQPHASVQGKVHTALARTSAARKPAKAVLPLDHDERGFGEF